MLSVEALMKRELVAVDPGASVAEAVRRMCEARVGAVLVLEHGRLASLAGIFSERDLLTRVVSEGRRPEATRVGEVATRPVVTVAAGASLRECAETLRNHGVRHLPILDANGRPAGILSARDFFEAVAGGLERLIEQRRYDEALRGNIDPYDHLGGSYGR